VRARDRDRERALRVVQEREEAQLAELLSRFAGGLQAARSHKAWARESRVIGLTGRTTDRRAILARLEAARVAHDGASEAIATALREMAPWIGTATDLLRHVAAPSRSHLSRALRRSMAALNAAGVRVHFRREAGTGRRLIEAGLCEDAAGILEAHAYDQDHQARHSRSREPVTRLPGSRASDEGFRWRHEHDDR